MTFVPAGNHRAGVRWLSFRNDASEAVPPFGVLRITGVETNLIPQNAVLLAAKPNADNGTQYVFNGPTPVEPGGFGSCTVDFPLFAAFDDSEAPEVGDEWGAQNDSWLLHKGKTGYKINGGPHDGRVEIRLSLSSSAPLHPFELDSGIAKGGDAPATLREWDGTTWQSTGSAVTVHDWCSLGPAASGDKGVAWLNPDSERYEIISLPSTGIALVRFYLNDNLTQGASASAQIMEWTGAAWAPNSGGPVTVHDSSDIGPGQSGDTGVAWLNNESGRYEIITLKRRGGSDLVRFYLNASLAQGGSASAQPMEWSGGAWSPMGGDPITVFDSSEIGPGEATDTGWAILSPQSGRHEILTLKRRGSGLEVRWGKAYQNADNEKAVPEVEVQEVTDKTGGTLVLDDASQPIHRIVLLPKHGGVKSNIQTGDVLAFLPAPPAGDDGDIAYVAVSDYSAGGGSGLALAEIAYELPQGSSTIAVLQEWVGGAWVTGSEAILLYDPAKQGPAAMGQVAWIQYSPEAERWELVEVRNAYARHIEFTLAETMGDGASVKLANVVDAFDGVPPGGMVPIYNRGPKDDGKYVFKGNIGDFGTAIFDPENGIYRINWIVCPTKPVNEESGPPPDLGVPPYDGFGSGGGGDSMSGTGSSGPLLW